MSKIGTCKIGLASVSKCLLTTSDMSARERAALRHTRCLAIISYVLTLMAIFKSGFILGVCYAVGKWAVGSYTDVQWALDGWPHTRLHMLWCVCWQWRRGRGWPPSLSGSTIFFQNYQQKIGAEIPPFSGKIELLSTLVICRKFAPVSRKIATFCNFLRTFLAEDAAVW